MQLSAANQLAIDLMEQHGVGHLDFHFDNAKRRFGACHYRRDLFTGECEAEKITLSRHLVKMNDEDTVRDTILHEIAHAIAGRDAHHGPAWRAVARKIGAKAERCYKTGEVNAPQKPWVLVCSNCGEELGKRFRRSNLNRHYHPKCGRDSMGKLKFVRNR